MCDLVLILTILFAKLPRIIYVYYEYIYWLFQFNVIMVIFQLQMMCIHLLDELIISSVPSDIWLDCINKHTILQILLPSLQQYIQVSIQGYTIRRAVILHLSTL